MLNQIQIKIFFVSFPLTLDNKRKWKDFSSGKRKTYVKVKLIIKKNYFRTRKEFQLNYKIETIYLEVGIK